MQKIDIRNTDKRLVAQYDPVANTIELLVKGCLTIISFSSQGGIEVHHIKR